MDTGTGGIVTNGTTDVITWTITMMSYKAQWWWPGGNLAMITNKSKYSWKSALGNTIWLVFVV